MFFVSVRGATVLSGPNGHGYRVVVLGSEVTVSRRRRTVTLKQGRERCAWATANPADGRVARRPHEARGRLHPLRKFARSTVGRGLVVGSSLAFAACSPPCGTSWPR